MFGSYNGISVEEDEVNLVVSSLRQLGVKNCTRHR